MEALAERLSHLDPHVQGTIRVVAFYDTLMRRRVDLAALARASAGLAECIVGIRLHGTGRVIRAAPDGREAAEPPSPVCASCPVTLDEEEIGVVWLERPGPPGPLDDVLLDRLAIAVAAAAERYGLARTTMADPALVELAVSPGIDDPARARALRLLGFTAGTPVHVAAVRSQSPLAEVAARLSRARPVKAAVVAGTGVVLTASLDGARWPADVRAGIGRAGSPERSWCEARTALRFTTAHEPVVRYDGLGALALLAEIPEAAARDNADVTALARIAGTPQGLQTLEAYCATGSVRRAAELLHLHHSSVARRLERIGKALGTDVTSPTGSTRAHIALTAWRLLNDLAEE
ncbi:helix-turn-helix domain-containing protein [Kitasatospora sp. NPDC085895]|uniref:PucR family transcriptional regulator n=1 Tax=Kitasatospora sp. NPDC085895 TaxID=3155057 RepID=UPI00344EDF87